MSPQLNRREVLGAGGAAGAVAALAGGPPTAAQAGHVELGRFVRRPGVQGKMTGAQAVAAALERLGVPRSDMVVSGRGMNDLRVPTPPGVREPQNRRVEIVFT